MNLDRNEFAIALGLVAITSFALLMGMLPKPKLQTVEATIPHNEQIATITNTPTASPTPEELFTLEEELNTEDFNCVMYAKQSIGRYYITAYSDLETGCKTTASGKKVHEGTITTCAVDPKLHKFGKVFEIDGKLYISEDTGGLVKGRHIDIFIHDMKKMSRYGSNYQEIYIVTFPFGKPE